MSNGSSILPPDIREQAERNRSRVGGVGGAAPENIATAQQREAAMGLPPPPEPESSEPAEEEKEEAKTCPNELCETKLDSTWDYCAKCGHDLVRGGPAKKLGITFEEQDVEDYLFRGYVVRDIKILGTHTVTMKSSQPEDLDAIDKHIMGGEFLKNEDGTERKISDFYMRQVNSLAFTAAGIQKLDGKSVGEALADRMKWLMGGGSALTDMLSTKVIWYNQAITEFLEAKDTISGS